MFGGGESSELRLGDARFFQLAALPGACGDDQYERQDDSVPSNFVRGRVVGQQRLVRRCRRSAARVVGVDATEACALPPNEVLGRLIVENGVTGEPDWAQAFARKGATLIAGTNVSAIESSLEQLRSLQGPCREPVGGGRRPRTRRGGERGGHRPRRPSVRPVHPPPLEHRRPEDLASRVAVPLGADELVRAPREVEDREHAMRGEDRELARRLRDRGAMGREIVYERSREQVQADLDRLDPRLKKSR